METSKELAKWQSNIDGTERGRRMAMLINWNSGHHPCGDGVRLFGSNLLLSPAGQRTLVLDGQSEAGVAETA